LLFEPVTLHDNSGGVPDLQWEHQVGHPKVTVAGVDEVGRGCLAGPVVAAAVILPADCSVKSFPWIAKIADSKKISHEVRESLVPLIEAWAVKFAVGIASVEEIDEINIHHASHLAMVRAVEQIRPTAGEAFHILVDGKFVPKGFAGHSTAIIKGDDKCLSIAAASILAKVWRDRLMVELEARYPGYEFGAHKGYFTPAHRKALAKLGPCEIHRRSFAPVAALL
jgi:ribonuclease HII